MNNRLFTLFDVPLIRTAKNRQVKVSKVLQRSLYLDIDEEIVSIKKTENGLIFSCGCDWCGGKGIANGVFNCGRILRAQNYLWKHNGRISEMEETRWGKIGTFKKK